MRFTDIAKIENETIFEDLVKDIIEADELFMNVNINGRKGQRQNGIDVYARYVKNLQWIGIQCKVRNTNRSFTQEELLHEVNDAKNFNPFVSEFYIYTTLSRDVETQKYERKINESLRKEASFRFQIVFWEDIKNKLRQQYCETVYYRYYHRYFKDNLVLGHAIGKLVNLELQFDNKFDSHYELIIGKIPRYKNDEGKQSDYFRGTYFIVNLLDRKMDTFLKDDDSNKATCFPTDIESAFLTKIDSYRICKWLRNIDNLDNFIYDDTHNYIFSITEEERQDYFKDKE